MGWEIAGGELVALGQGGDHANDVLTDEEFENFELMVDWKLSPKANSGIFYNVVEKGYDMAYATGPEYQLIDDDGWPDKLEAWQQTAANYAMHTPTKKATKPIGQWNQTRIVVNRGHVQHWLNGARWWVRPLDARVGAPGEGGEVEGLPGYGRAKRGRIGLRDHGNKISFRGIKIRAL